MKPPKSISGIMAEEAARADESASSRVMAVLGLCRIWPEIVGGPAAAHCFPAGFRKGVLTVAAESSAWTQEMSFLGPEIQKRLDQALGPGVITELRFKTAKLPALKKRFSGRDKPASRHAPKPAPPPDPALKARLERELAKVKDPELRAVLLRVRLAAESRRGTDGEG